MRKIAVAAWIIIGLFTPLFSPYVVAEGEPNDVPLVQVFGRDDCGFCKALFAYLEDEAIPFTYHNIITDKRAAIEYDAVVSKHALSQVTPITVVGEEVFLGFNGPRTTGAAIKRALEQAKEGDIQTVADHLARAPVQVVTLEGGCSGIVCDEGAQARAFVFELSLLGVVDLRAFSLGTLSFLLGVIDGFNPCAMWVLVTFLVLLSQAGSRRKMIILAGIFILAQGIMYNLILNVWYKTWDFVALDHLVTPLVGLLALGGGTFFLWRWHNNKKAQLVCDISDIETQSKTINRFKQVVRSPITLASIGAILVIAFSVNVIEFACSIGIPQAYTKILELNVLPFFERQWYILIFSLGYMLDDVVVFGLAIWGYSRLEAHGGKYAQWSLLIGGVLMLALGLLLVFDPSVLVW